MKKALCHYSFHRRWEQEGWSIDRMAAEARQLAVDGVDFHVRFLGSPAEAVKPIKSALARHELTLSGFSMSNNFYQPTAEEFDAQVAAELRAPSSRIFGGYLAPAQLNDSESRAQGHQQVLDGLGEVVQEAAKYGVVLGLENHGGLPCTGEEQVGMIETIRSPFLKAVIDVGNYLQGGQEGHVGTQVAIRHAAYVHFKDFKKVPALSTPWGWTTEACTLGHGGVDHRACLKVLREAGYKGFVALEYEGPEDEAVGVPQSIEFMKTLM